MGERGRRDGNRQTFAHLLRQCRGAAHLTQEGLAERAGISERTIRKLERGEPHLPRADTVQLLIEALELPPEKASAFRQSASKIVTAKNHAPPGQPLWSTIALPPTPLLGRERELDAASHLLRQNSIRLVTIIGAGGVGKTRLAVELARALASSFPDSVHMVALSPVRDYTMVPAMLAGLLGLEQTGQASVADLLKGHFASAPALVLLDNFEHVLPAAPFIADLLGVCPQLKILVTSRAPLHVRGEHEFPLAPLELPSGMEGISLDSLAAIPSVTLFVERARAVQPSFRLDASNADLVSTICRRLDGLPLAIELAAARSKVLSPHNLLARIETARLPLLIEGPRDLPPRQRTLRATLEWSYQLLSPDAQVALRRLSVFAGGWTVEAGEALCAVQELSTKSSDRTPLDSLSTLVDHSLVQRMDQHGDQRFSMLEAVREYAWERLCANGEEALAVSLHMDHYLHVAEEAALRLGGADQKVWIAHLKAEQDNLRAALRWGVERGEAELSLRFVVALWRFWEIQGSLTEGRQWLDRVLALVNGAPQAIPLYANALNAAGLLAFRQGDHRHALSLHEQALALRRGIGDQRAISSSLNNLGLVAKALGDLARAEQYFTESLNFARSLGDGWVEALVLANLGNVAMLLGQRSRAIAVLQNGLALARAQNTPDRIASLLNNLGLAYLELGDYERAHPALEECLALYRGMEYRHGVAGVLQNLGEVAYWCDDFDRATALCTESLALLEELGEQQNLAYPLSTLGEIARRSGDLAQALQLHMRSLEIRRACSDTGGSGASLLNLGRTALDRGDPTLAERFYRESLAIQWAVEEKSGVISCLEGIASTQCLQRRFEPAALLFAWAKVTRSGSEIPLNASERARLDEFVSMICSNLGEPRFTTLWAEGETLSLEDAIAFVGLTSATA